ncbi:MAG: ion transporter [Lachnospiraceae bacterium]|nr:ion transporter [Lachnospiraceae bacterium]
MRLFRIVEVGYTEDFVSRSYDILGVLAILINLIASILMTFDGISARWGGLLEWIEAVTVIFFAVDYVFRLITSGFLYPDKRRGEALVRYMFSFTGVVDLLSFLPYFLPVFFPEGAIAFRMFRIIRVFRLFRINAYYDSLNVITSVIVSKKQQLLSSVFIILVLMLGSSLCMYSIEHSVQPDVFENAFSGMWWAVSTLLTVGYGDIYPITTAGRAFGIAIAFLGVGMVAIPTGIISAGFVEQYQKLSELSEEAEERDLQFIRVRLAAGDYYVGRTVRQMRFPKGIAVGAVEREGRLLLPDPALVLMENDIVLIGAESFTDKWNVNLLRLELKNLHPWVGEYVRDLDLSRQSLIVAIRRNGKKLVPDGDTKLLTGDILFLYSRKKIIDTTKIPL